MARTDQRSRESDRSGWARSLADQPLSSLRFARSRIDAVISGVAGGLGERWGVDPLLVRIAFVVTSFSGAVGVVAYLAAWWISLDPGDPRAPPPRQVSSIQSIAFGCMTMGSVFLLREVGLWMGDTLGRPLLIGAVGAGIIYFGTGKQARRRPRSAHDQAPGRPPLLHLLLGGLLVAGGVAWFLTSNRSLEGFFSVILAVGVTTVGLAIVFGPWIYRLANQLGEERRDRIRSEERSELAAHLHDSVLQTLALIQRNAASPRKMASLARRQERELRAWLYGQAPAHGHLEASIQEIADATEEAHEVTVEAVVVGDCVLDERSWALVQACREAATNAARHSGTDEISVYVECEAAQVAAYVRDRGKGFDPDAIPPGRRGILDSIRRRVERQGGSVTITSSPGEGCEVQMIMPMGAER